MQSRIGNVVIVGLAATTAGCGVDNLGVQSVQFNLQPATADQVPDGVDVRPYAAATGTTRVDALMNTGMVHAMGLPALHEKSAYRVMLFFADHERDALPVSTAALVRWHHGDEEHDEGPSGQTIGLGEMHGVTVGMLMRSEETGMWMITVSDADTEGHPLGAIRGAMIMLADVEDRVPPILVMSGAVGQDESTQADDSHTGHVHGA